MSNAFLYLIARTTYNRIVRQLKRVRNPRYAIAVVLGVTYVWFFLFSRLGTGGSTPGSPFAYITSDTGRELVAVGVLLLFAVGWVFSRRADALAFTPAEVYFLFPAPVTRRTLIVFKLFRLQIATLISTLIWVVLVRRGSGDLGPVARGIGLWTLFATLSMHRIGAALVQASIAQHGVAGLRRQRVVTTVLALLLALYAWASFSGWKTVAATQTAETLNLLQTFRAILEQPMLHALMQPFRMLAGAAFASGRAEWLAALPFALAIATAHFIWVVTANIAFEEAAVEASAKLAKRIADFRSRGTRAAPEASARTIRSTSLPLSPAGNPAVAIVWKNALALLRSMRGAWLIALVLIAYSVLWMVFAATRPQVAQMMMMTMNGMVLLWAVILGPRFVRNDLRADLAQLSLLKTYPLPGSRIVAAEVASATLSLTAFQMLPVLIVFISLFFQHDVQVGVADRVLILAAAPFILTAINSVNVGIQNGAAVMFPAWMSIGANRPTGVEALGQGLLLAVASLFLLALALIPAAITGTLSYFAFAAMPWRMRIAAIVVSGLLVLFLEVVGLMLLLGRLFERTEPSAVT